MDTVHPLADEHTALASSLAAKGVEYALGGWIDVLGRSKSKIVPIDHLPNLLAGSERYTPRGMGGLGPMTSDEDECVAMPDVSTLTVLPWDPRFAWMAADLLFGGTQPWALCPRSLLKRQLTRAANAGYVFNLGVETEFFAFRPESLDRADGHLVPVAPSGGLYPTPAYDVESSLDAMPFLHAMVKAMKAADFGVYSFDHEGGDAQFEFDFAYAPALQTADRISLFRLMARQVAKQCGLIASFMPKPFTGSWGSGHHFNMSLESAENGANLFRSESDPRGMGWSRTAYEFTAGVLRHAGSITALGNPTVNSYKRLSGRLADGSISWAPSYAAYGDNNRSCMMRLPRNRPALENRSVDSAANTYLTAALMLAAGLEGIEKGLDPGDPVTTETFSWAPGGHRIDRLPRNLLEAVDAFADDPLVHEVFPPQFVHNYLEMKNQEWDDYHSQVTPWERQRYLVDL